MLVLPIGRNHHAYVVQFPKNVYRADRRCKIDNIKTLLILVIDCSIKKFCNQLSGLLLEIHHRFGIVKADDNAARSAVTTPKVDINQLRLAHFGGLGKTRHLA